MLRSVRSGGMVKVLGLLGVTLAVACGSGGGTTNRDGGLPFGGDGGSVSDGGSRTDGGTVRADGGTVRADGGARMDGGARTDGGGGGTGHEGDPCTVAHDCFLGFKCDNSHCTADQGGIGTDCDPNSGAGCSQTTGCTGTLPNNTSVCTADCQSDSDCPGNWTCQTVQFSVDGGTQSATFCLAPDALGKPCTNFTPDGQSVDPTWDCTVDGTFCNPESNTSNTGHCVQGDNCNFQQQTGCPANNTCHPLGIFGIDNTNGRICLPCAASGGAQGASCQDDSNCGKGYICIPVDQQGHKMCLKYCTPNSTTHNCNGIAGQPGPDGGARAAQCIDLMTDAQGNPQPDAVTSIPAGVCF